MALPVSSVVIRGEHLADKTVGDSIVISNGAGANSTIGTEIGVLETADAALQADIDQNEADADAAIAAEAVSRANADTALETAYIAADSTLSSSAMAQRIVEFGLLSDLVTAEGVSRANADSALSSSAMAQRIVEFNALSAQVSAEAVSRANAVSGLSSSADAALLQVLDGTRKFTELQFAANSEVYTLSVNASDELTFVKV